MAGMSAVYIPQNDEGAGGKEKDPQIHEKEGTRIQREIYTGPPKWKRKNLNFTTAAAADKSIDNNHVEAGGAG